MHDALHATYPEWNWPVYLQRQTDYSGCTRFGSGSLVSTYLAWRRFRREYPKRYTEASRTEEGKVLEELNESACACGDAASVEQEFREFIGRVPASEARTSAERRLSAIRSNPALIRYGCKSG